MIVECDPEQILLESETDEFNTERIRPTFVIDGERCELISDLVHVDL